MTLTSGTVRARVRSVGAVAITVGALLVHASTAGAMSEARSATRSVTSPTDATALQVRAAIRSCTPRPVVDVVVDGVRRARVPVRAGGVRSIEVVRSFATGRHRIVVKFTGTAARRSCSGAVAIRAARFVPRVAAQPDDETDRDDRIGGSPVPDAPLPPSISIVAPERDGVSVTTGALSVIAAAQAQAPRTVRKVEFLVDGVVVASDFTAPFAADIPVAAIELGSRALTARATDTAGLTGVSAARSFVRALPVVVQPPVPDPDPEPEPEPEPDPDPDPEPPVVVAPSATLTAPSNDLIAMGPVTATATASADVTRSVARVEFLVDGQLVQTDTSPPWSAALGTLTPGAHQVAARVVDSSGATAVSAGHTVTQPSFVEQFDGTAGTKPASATWNIQSGDWGAGNKEDQCYANSTSNVRLDGAGHLEIVARSAPGTACQSRTLGHTSARIDTIGKRHFQFGRIEARMRVPTGKGLWPAFWTVGQNNYSDGWPESGEIDILEAIGTDTGTKVVHGTMHGPSGPKGALTGRWQYSDTVLANDDLSADFHVYGIVWSPGVVEYQFDGVTYNTIRASQLTGQQRWVFDTTPQGVILNLAVGGVGSWPGPPSAQTPFPATMQVDWVRVIPPA